MDTTNRHADSPQETGKWASSAPTPETYAALQTAYDHLNRRLFGGSLPNGLVTLQRRSGCPGLYRPAPFERIDGTLADEIALNPALFAGGTLEEPLSQLAHDMTHLWQRVYGTPGRARYHNREWAAKMKAIGLHPSTTGAPGGKETGERMAQWVMAGGPFARALADLIDTGFVIPWSARVATGATTVGSGRSGRWFKYVCPFCGLIARARYGARLICADDMVALEPADDPTGPRV
ncbi:SprT-like domain-containing protein [Rhodospira trueperi]|uniref:SprT-like family protein n=1 Tax=Rhodospira trueperi TaxID=69960 RepID=A0A1G7HH69_9PROT|nr:SprT-like domain-containing protein [Rhodospira trueperi]SDE99634.1 SprT-like family protein [Rhodospira trueperi]